AIVCPPRTTEEPARDEPERLLGGTGPPSSIRPTAEPLEAVVAVSPVLRHIEPVEWRAAVRPPRAPLAVVIPAFDAAALGGATMLVDHADLLGIAYIAIAFLVLMAAGTERTRINPKLSDDVAPLVGWLSLPVLLVAPLTRSDEALGHLVRIVPVAMALVVAARFLAYNAIRETRARGLILEPTL